MPISPIEMELERIHARHTSVEEKIIQVDREQAIELEDLKKRVTNLEEQLESIVLRGVLPPETKQKLKSGGSKNGKPKLLKRKSVQR